MRILKGIAASAGIGIGKTFLYVHEKIVIPHNNVEEEHLSVEKKRFHLARKKVDKQLNKLVQDVSSDEHKKILETHLLMLQDPEFIESVEKLIESEKICVEWAVERIVSSLIEMLDSSNDPLLRERKADFYDIGWRIIWMLMGKNRPNLSIINEEVVLVADTLLPSEALTLDPTKIKAIALDRGGRTSHVAILARALQIPTVLGLGRITQKVKMGDEIIVDGNVGEVSVRPNSASAKKMNERYIQWMAHEKELEQLTDLETITKDGHTVLLKANIETVEELEAVVTHGAVGIGLFRSEFLFLKPGGATEEEQFIAYKSVVEKMKDIGPVTIRTIDVGGDKVIPGMEGLGEENPILGWRAVRFCLSRKDIFRIQLRAILRASAFGKTKIMFPMISGPEELDNVIIVLEQVKDECRRTGIEFDEDIEVGIMIEVPSAALVADLLATKTDFFSIGTNDLIQYTIAVDRGNDKIAYLYQPFHPGVLRLIRMIIEKGHEHNIPVAMCGEMAGDPLSTLLLVGLGLDEFSMSPMSILEIKNIIRSITLQEAKELVETVMEMKSHININTYIREWMHDRFGSIITT
ncbi:MAG: phosphoenolpyruvate--protein phosphotransferase [Spirochaetia bacterium]|nr:phosphoenolpyruvate--protein phosphotransferase [Spirochaetia bacterium]